MKNLYNIISVFFASIFSSNAFAHAGHVEQVAGHTHSLATLSLYSIVPVLMILAIVAFFVLRRKNNI